MSNFGRTSHIFCVHIQSSCVEAVRRGSRMSRRSMCQCNDQRKHVQLTTYPVNIQDMEEILCVRATKNLKQSFRNMQAGIILLKNNSKNAQKEQNYSVIQQFHWCAFCCSYYPKFWAPVIVHDVQSQYSL